MRLKRIVGLAAISLVIAGPATGADSAPANELSVRVDNLSRPVLCAEEDNVTLIFSSKAVRRFRIEARHPAYLGSLRDDNWQADWTACDFGPVTANSEVPTKAKTSPPPPERVTLYETVDRWLVGLRFPNFWREATATVHVGDKVATGLHLLQLWRVRPNGGEEIVVLYPQDGYWRARPIAPRGRDLTAFGSSFLIGPVEKAGRPLVQLTKVTYLPDLEGFDISFKLGGSAQVRIREASTDRLALDVTFNSGPLSAYPFAALRSMYVASTNNDVSSVARRSKGAKGWQEDPIMSFGGGEALELWAGRTTPSRHNTSSPDMVFKWFR